MPERDGANEGRTFDDLEMKLLGSEGKGSSERSRIPESPFTAVPPFLAMLIATAKGSFWGVARLLWSERAFESIDPRIRDRWSEYPAQVRDGYWSTFLFIKGTTTTIVVAMTLLHLAMAIICGVMAYHCTGLTRWGFVFCCVYTGAVIIFAIVTRTGPI